MNQPEFLRPTRPTKTAEFLRLTDRTININLIEWIDWDYTDECIDLVDGQPKLIRIVFAQDCDEIFIPHGCRDAYEFEEFMARRSYLSAFVDVSPEEDKPQEEPVPRLLNIGREITQKTRFPDDQACQDS